MSTRWLWVAYQQLQTESAIEELLSVCQTGHITHVVPVMHRWDGALLNSTMLIKTGLRLGGLLPINYLTQEAHEIGIKVMPWWILGTTEEWIQSWDYIWPGGFPTEWNTNQLSDCNISCLNFSLPEVRQTIQEIAIDLKTQNPEMDGLSIDYVRYEGGMAQEVASLNRLDIDLTVQNIAEIWGLLVLSGVPPYVSGDYAGGWDTEGCAQHWEEWVALGLVDYVKAMNYMRPSNLSTYLTRHYDNNLTDGVKAHVVNGISLNYSNLFSPEELDESIQITTTHGYPFAVFDSDLFFRNNEFVNILASHPLNGNGGNGGDEMEIVATLIVDAQTLREIANRLDAAAATLSTLDEAAQAAVVEAQEALEAVQEIEEAL